MFMQQQACLDKKYSVKAIITAIPPPNIVTQSDSLEKKSFGGLRAKGQYKVSTEDKPLISIITVVMNGIRYFGQSLKSVIDQTYDNIEYIVVDGGSTDGTLNILHENDQYIDYWISEPDKGIYDAINKGISLSTGDYIGILQSDDWYDVDIVNCVVEEIQKQRQTVFKVIYANYTIVNETYSTYRKFESTMKYWLGMSISHQSMFISADIYNKLGMYDTNYKLAADYDLLLKMITNRVDFFGVHNYGVFFRLGGLSSRSNSKSIDEAKAINRKYLGRFSKKHFLFLFHIYKHILSDQLELFFFRIFGEDFVITIRKKIKKMRNHNH